MSEKMIYRSCYNRMGNIVDAFEGRSTKVGRMSFYTFVDWDSGTVNWTMSLCSPKDTFSKKIAKKLCAEKPIMAGVARLPMQVIDCFPEKENGGVVASIIEDVVFNDMIQRVGSADNLPTWFIKYLADEFTYQYQ